jgi:Two component regulator propeller
MKSILSALGAASVTTAAIVCASGVSAAAPHTYPQLMASKYPAGLPAGVTQPKPDFSFVDASKLPGGATILSAAHGRNGSLWVLTNKGSFKTGKDGKDFGKLEHPKWLKPLQPPVFVDTVVNCVAGDKDGNILAGTNYGLYITDGNDWWHRLDRRDGMPVEDIRCLYEAPNGDIWAGTDQGAWRMRSGRFRYFAGKRWLPGNHVSAIWGDQAGKIWLQTDAGYACIEEKEITLGQKAKYFNDFTLKYNNRRGYINEKHLTDPANYASGKYEASDNDGLWNGIYVAAMAYRYGATHDEQARKDGWLAMKAMLELERLTGISGFPARAVVTDEELKKGIDGFSADETVRVDGETDKIWFRSKVDPTVWCKGDTSSDELDGHYFAWTTFYDLAATPEQKKEIAATCKRVTDNIIEHGFNLVGHTGRRTRWGVFSPESINDDPIWSDQRALNSMQMLAYLKATYHFTHEDKYEKLYEMLINKHHYLLNTLAWRTRTPAEWQNINHSDDEMAYMNYHTLLTLETDPARRKIILQTFRGTWEDTGVLQSLKFERSPFYNYMYGGLSGAPCAPDEAEESLQDWPWDRVQWRMVNSKRDDVTFKTGRGLNAARELTRVLPISERALHRWNGNPFDADAGGDGRTLDDGAAWLLGYWVGVYYGYLPAEKL